MAFCRNCGSEITEGTRFCPSCGSSAEENMNGSAMGAARSRGYYGTGRRAGNAGKGASTVVIEMGKYYGILLLILAFVDIWLSYGVVMIGVSVIVIVGSICCLNKFYGYRGFTTAALIIALVCLLCGTNFKLKTDLLGKIGIEKGQDVVVTNTAQETKPVKGAAVIIEEAESGPQLEETAVESEETAEETVEESVNGVDPDLKAFLDSYESFMDEYIDFMKKYEADPNNAITYMTEYLEMLQKYEEFAKKIDQYDSNSMSIEDAKYYLEVVDRVDKKLENAL